MKRHAAIALTVAILLAGCGPSTTAPEVTPEGDVASAAVTEAAPSAGVLAPDVIVGRWSVADNCENPIVINADGSFESNGQPARWSLEGDRLLLSGDSGEFAMPVAMPNADTLMIGQPDGSFGSSRRC